MDDAKAASAEEAEDGEAAEALAIAGECFDALFEAAFSRARGAELDARRVPNEVRWSMEQCRLAVTLFFLSEDTGTTPGSWDLEAEPVPAPTDHWSRGVVGLETTSAAASGSLLVLVIV